MSQNPIQAIKAMFEAAAPEINLTAELNAERQESARLRHALAVSEATARTDGLTGLMNRMEVDRLIDGMHRQIADLANPHSRRRPTTLNKVMGVFFIDIDHFKGVNDTHGHAAGDAVLRQFAERLLANMRAYVDIVGRYGGDEMIVGMQGLDAQDIIRKAEQLRKNIEEIPFILPNGQSIYLTASIGVALFDGYSSETTADVVARADIALYVAKNGGRNCVSVNEPPNSIRSIAVPALAT